MILILLLISRIAPVILYKNKDFSSLVEKANIIADSIGNVYTDLEHVSQNMNTYVKCIMEIDSENLTQDESDVEVPTTSVDTLTTAAQTSTEKVTWSTAGATATSLLSSGSYSNYSGSSSGNYTYSYSTGPSGTTVYNNNFSSSSLTSADYNVPAGGVYNYEGIEKYLEDIEGVTVTLPEVGFITPLTIFNNVDLPAPLLPIRPTTSPFFT